MTVFCISLMSLGLGLFAALMCYAWLDERSDRHAGIKWSRELHTYINWEQRLGLYPSTKTQEESCASLETSLPQVSSH